MPRLPKPPDAIHRYFVDEAGDLTFFDSRGRDLIGSEGVSHCFFVGAALIHEPELLEHELDDLRKRLLSDPYFAGAPSMAPGAGKTATLFHAKNDLPEVRRGVFGRLRDARVEVFVAFRRKRSVVPVLRAQLARTGRKLGSEFIYEQLTQAVFKDRLHLAEVNHIVFARRGKSDRNVALAQAISLAKTGFEERWRKGIDRPTTIASSTPSESVGLQVVDYYLWALQRFVERREARFFEFMSPAFKLIHDIDDVRRHRYGEYYTSSNALTPEKLMPVT